MARTVNWRFIAIAAMMVATAPFVPASAQALNGTAEAKPVDTLADFSENAIEACIVNMKRTGPLTNVGDLNGMHCEAHTDSKNVDTLSISRTGDAWRSEAITAVRQPDGTLNITTTNTENRMHGTYLENKDGAQLNAELAVPPYKLQIAANKYSALKADFANSQGSTVAVKPTVQAIDSIRRVMTKHVGPNPTI